MKIKVLAIILACLSCFFFSTASTTAFAEEDITYPFDYITIESAYHFDIVFDEVPDEDSYFYGAVDQGETVNIYIGTIKMESEEESSYCRIVILTNEANEDIAQWLLNGYSNENGTESLNFSAHITIDPEIGVVKLMEDYNLDTHQASITKSDLNECSFVANNDAGTYYHEFDMVTGSYEEETDLNIVIAAYVEGGQ